MLPDAFARTRQGGDASRAIHARSAQPNPTPHACREDTTMAHRHFMFAASRMSERAARGCVLGALLWGAASFAAAADVTVQPAAGSGFVVKDSGGANDRLRVQENGQVSLPAVPTAATQSQSVCIA